jgi:N-acetylglucosamine-6-phosphate deacetylase
MITAFICAVCITPLETLSDAVVVVEDGVVASVGPGNAVEVPRNALAVDYRDAVLAPGFIDIHVHGGAGHDVMEGTPEALDAIERHLAEHGTTSYFPTTVTAPVDRTLHALEGLADRIERGASGRVSHDKIVGASPLGINVEGPFISPKKRGVHSLQDIKEGSVELFDRMWQAARGHIRLMTVAPEIPRAEELIAAASGRGVCVSLGHSDATMEETQRGIAKGARHVTHIFNAMRPLDHREPGIVGAALSDDRLSAEVIADGVHVAPEVVRLFLRAKGAERAVLVTDGISATGMPDGEYRLGGLVVQMRGGVCRSEGRLAGSVLTMDRAVRNVMEFCGCALDVALRLATLNPARVTAVSNRKGVIAPGADADFVVLSRSGEVMKTIIAGVVV